MTDANRCEHKLVDGYVLDGTLSKLGVRVSESRRSWTCRFCLWGAGRFVACGGRAHVVADALDHIATEKHVREMQIRSALDRLEATLASLGDPS